uniref:Cytochrome P450 82A2 n=1 Tax=Tanacetum cinerariifolium TaxID=118510 RepID=A0A699HCE9_TANCI|nr:cytochrome P450 82A2 [Tanacetum cinerariifolium]
MFAESLQVGGNKRCTLTLILVGSKWSLSLLCIITCPVDCTHADIASCVGANCGLCRQSVQSISVDTQANDLDNILEKWSDEHKEWRETGLKGETKPDLTCVLISILEGFEQPVHLSSRLKVPTISQLQFWSGKPPHNYEFFIKGV